MWEPSTWEGEAINLRQREAGGDGVGRYCEG